MRIQQIVMSFAGMLFLSITALQAGAQTVPPGKQYVDMSRAERLVFVDEQARRIARDMSGSEYQFTSEFEQDILRALTQYAERIGKTENERGKRDLRLVLE